MAQLQQANKATAKANVSPAGSGAKGSEVLTPRGRTVSSAPRPKPVSEEEEMKRTPSFPKKSFFSPFGGGR